MASLEINTPDTQEDQKDSCTVLADTSFAPLNFSGLTPSQFGISVQSFTPASLPSSKRKDKSRLAQLKARRRSSVGVRGSPETNSLIRFIAQQKMKTPTSHRTPEVRSFSGYNRTNLDAGKENHPRLMTPTPGKRRRVGPIQGCEMEIREASAPTLHFSLREQEVHSLWPCTYLTAINNLLQTNQLLICVFHILLCAGEVDSTVGPTVKRKKKQVRFGRPLSPELFDKTLPPSTPLQKGSTPARAPTPGGSLKLRSLLKTPERNEPQTPTQQDPSSPTMFGASPTLIVLRSRRMSSTGEDDEETDGKVFIMPSKDCIFNKLEVITRYHLILCLIPLNLNLIKCNDIHFIRVRECDSETVDIMYPYSDSLFPQQPEESEPVKRSTRSAAKSASGKMKMTSTATRRWNREVDRSLYGSREYASKNPALSPITERRSFISNLQDQMEEKVDECCEGQATISQEDSKETLLTQTILENLGDATEELCAANSAQSLCTDTDGKAECPTRSDSPTSVCRPAGEEFKDTLSLSAQRKVKRGRRSQRMEERGQGEQAASQQENNRSGSDSHEEERAAHLCLAPWQADFNFEDVFKPVAARGQRSVRRSLRNQSNLDHGSNGTGLAWLPHISPDSSKEARRRTRGRRLSGALPAKPSVPEEDTAGTETA
uniref:PP1-binding domain-containing protein n=1 Tax=Sphaeramia orbicularis TaxID=375764 RepID=A0A673A1W7_9TELE